MWGYNTGVAGESLVLFVRVLHCVVLQWFITEATEKSCNYNDSTRFSVLLHPPFLFLLPPAPISLPSLFVPPLLHLLFSLQGVEHVQEVRGPQRPE